MTNPKKAPRLAATGRGMAPEKERPKPAHKEFYQMDEHPLSNYRVTGDHVEHTAWPRFTLDMHPGPLDVDGRGGVTTEWRGTSWNSRNFQWLDQPTSPPLTPETAAHLVRRAGDAWRAHREAESN